MLFVSVVTLSAVLQLAAAVLAIRLLKITGERIGWGLIAAATILMTARRFTTLYEVAAGHTVSLERLNETSHLAPELIALAISVLLIAGLAIMTPFFIEARNRNQALRQSETTLRDAQEVAHLGSWECDFNSGTSHWSDELFRILGRPPGSIVPSFSSYLACVHPDDQARVSAHLEGAKSDGLRFFIDHRIVRPDGSERIVHLDGNAESDNHGKPLRLRSVVHDITEVRDAEALTTRLGRIIEDSVNEIYVFDAETLKFIQVNRGARENLGYSDAELHALTPIDLKPEFTREKFERRISPLRDGKREVVTFETIHRRKDGSTYDVEVRISMSRVGSPPVFVAIIEDITERKATAEALRRSEAHFRALSENALDLLLLTDVRGVIKFVSPSAKRILGYRPEDLIGKMAREIVHPDDRSKAIEFRTKLLSRPGFTGQIEFRARHADGSWRQIDAIIRNLLHDPDIGAVVTNARDVTERVAMEEQLRQSQKMEAIGQLTGGVAHDFNNLLTVILGNLDMLGAADPDNEELRQRIDPALRATERGALLIERLLAFSRRQALQPKLVDVNELIRDTIDLLARTLGETIQIAPELSDEIWKTEIDPIHLEHALLNLAINARDAMPNGGTLRIATSTLEYAKTKEMAPKDLAPGQYVVICVTDTGAGMSPETLRRAFEPFFTTKGIGKGTGLGLSMVYGFVKQSGGHVSINSAVGNGTTVCLHLPRAAIDEDVSGLPGTKEAADGGFETILVLEDDADVQTLTETLLSDLGYTVLAASTGQEALEILKSESSIELLLADVVLPGGMSGVDTAKQAVAYRPGIKILYMSGYSENAIVDKGRLKPGVHLIQKPFRKADLARKVREVLDIK